MKFITTMNEKIFHRYGRRLLESFHHYSNLDIGTQIIIFTEEKSFLNSFPQADFPRAEVRLFDSKINLFLDKYAGSKKNNGYSRTLKLMAKRNILKFKLPRVDFYSYDFLHDSVRFSFKSFAWAEALNSYDDKIIYLDSDCHFHSIFNEHSFEDLIGECDYAYFGRVTYTETGILFFNNQSMRLLDLGRDIADFYVSGRIYKLDYWTDCHVIDCLVNQEKYTALHKKNLTINVMDDHPIAHSQFAKFIDHRKGERKMMVSSPEMSNV